MTGMQAIPDRLRAEAPLDPHARLAPESPSRGRRGERAVNPD